MTNDPTIPLRLPQAHRSAVVGLLSGRTTCLALNAKHFDGEQRPPRRGYTFVASLRPPCYTESDQQLGLPGKPLRKVEDRNEDSPCQLN